MAPSSDGNSRKSVLFVCLGNICRSPTGEGVLRALVNLQQLQGRIEIDSAGTIDFHQGKPPDPRMRRAAQRRGVALDSRARQVRRDDLETFDLVIAMDRDNMADLKRLHPAPTAQLCLFSDFLDQRWPVDVPDPYYGGDDGFEYVLDMIQAGCSTIIEQLLVR